MKKDLTKEGKGDIIVELSVEGEASGSSEPRKKLEKSLEKGLTKGSGCDIINKLSTEGGKLLEN